MKGNKRESLAVLLVRAPPSRAIFMDWLKVFIELFGPVSEQVKKLKELLGINDEENNLQNK